MADSETTPRRTRPTRPQRKPTQKASPPKRTPTPPNRVEPGFVHRKLAAAVLKGFQNSAANRDIPLSVGELPEPVSNGDSPTEDGREPVELLARIFAHIGHRTPGLRKIEKRLEGTDARSGLASDILALFGQLLSRNEEFAMTVVENTVKSAVSTREAANKDKAPMPEPFFENQTEG